MEKNPQPVTPMLAQYLEIKRQHPDSILFYRLGDFYEMFFDDAIRAAPILEVQLTSRDRNATNPVPMCGVPHHSAIQYIQKLLEAGLKVALCEQTEDPSVAKGIVRREVTRVLTPGLIPDPELVSGDSSHFLICLAQKSDEEMEICLLDLLEGEVRLGVVKEFSELRDLFFQYVPKEILVPSAANRWVGELLGFFPQIVVTKRENYFNDNSAFSAISQYLKETQKIEEIPHLRNPLPLFESTTLQLDMTALSSLEVVTSQGKSLFDVLNFTLTPMGRRALRARLTRPSNDPVTIELRQAAVSMLVNEPASAEALSALLSQIRDLERLTTKTALGLAMPRDLVAIREILKTIPAIKRALIGSRPSLLEKIRERLSPLPELTASLESALQDLPPASFRDGGIFRDGFRPEIAEYRNLSRDAKSTIAAMEAGEKARTSIPSLKIRYSKVFGYTIEITKSYLSKVPSHYTRKQTIANGERFITEELKELESKILTADHRLRALEEELFLNLRSDAGAHACALFENARLIGELDVLLSFARAARERGYVCPIIERGWDLLIEEGKHPVIETLVPQGQFVPNSISLTQSECRTLIITGPNMGGKSTAMRQVALLVLMAHCGSFVPAKSASIPLVDAIFTRIGSSDDLTHGRSTFMVEMSEVGSVLRKASHRSLVLIDEIGRGTSTYDGLSLAWSLLEYLHTKIGAKVLFATHFHELTSLEKNLPQLKNANVLVERWKDEIVFLHKLSPGICNRSYGVEVARLAGLPSEVLLRAREILGHLETQSQRANRTRSHALELHDNQMVFFDGLESLESRSTPEN